MVAHRTGKITRKGIERLPPILPVVEEQKGEQMFKVRSLRGGGEEERRSRGRMKGGLNSPPAACLAVTSSTISVILRSFHFLSSIPSPTNARRVGASLMKSGNPSWPSRSFSSFARKAAHSFFDASPAIRSGGGELRIGWQQLGVKGKGMTCCCKRVREM